MSSASKKEHDEIDCLVLDMGIYPSNSVLKNSLINVSDNKNLVVELDLSNTKASKWDDVLDLVLKAKRIITL